MEKFIDYYVLLNILPTANEELIKRAYRIQSKELHPDQGGNEKQFILLTEAYKVLSNPIKRKAYDQDYAFYQQTQKRDNERSQQERKHANSKRASESPENKPFFSFDYIRFGKVALGGFISLGVLAKAINAFEESTEPEIPIDPIVFPVVESEHSKDIVEESVTSEYDVGEIEESGVETMEQLIGIPEESEPLEDLIEESEQAEVEKTATLTFSTTDSLSLYVRYLDRIYKLEADLESYGKVWETGSDAEITQASYNQLKIWDDLLNEIYQTLKIELTEKDFLELRDLQRAWIAKKERIADEARTGFAGGSWEVPVYNDAQLEETKKRCYWLVMNYMN
ncbi:DnaJ domain-containing protein [Planococcus halocryophilus]|uniref:DnaJ domain-containing protein n=1 Tax=Planococcus halocryophilus TaxID=1215089 RepID=UPI001F0E013E|nr:DnaJ domain-containing protein [Planococcus halocryophilus]MCH4826759.1 DnaJ domain-containing protein [Planococcus halocryophilus]